MKLTYLVVSMPSAAESCMSFDGPLLHGFQKGVQTTAVARGLSAIDHDIEHVKTTPTTAGPHEIQL